MRVIENMATFTLCCSVLENIENIATDHHDDDGQLTSTRGPTGTHPANSSKVKAQYGHNSPQQPPFQLT